MWNEDLGVNIGSRKVFKTYREPFKSFKTMCVISMKKKLNNFSAWSELKYRILPNKRPGLFLD